MKTFEEYVKSINSAALSPAMIPHYKELKHCWEAATKAARNIDHTAKRSGAEQPAPEGKRGIVPASDIPQDAKTMR